MNNVLQQTWLVTAQSGVSLETNYLDSDTTVVTIPNSMASSLSGTIPVSLSGLRNPKIVGSQLVTLEIEVFRMGLLLLQYSHSSQVVFSGPLNLFSYSGTPWSPSSIARNTYQLYTLTVTFNFECPASGGVELDIPAGFTSPQVSALKIKTGYSGA